MTERPQPASSPLDARIASASAVVAALALSVVLMAVAGTFVAPRGADVAPTAAIPFVAVAFFAMLGSVLFRRVSLQPLRLLETYERTGEAGLSDLMFRVTIVSAALAEAVGAVGLVLGIVTGDTYYMYALCFIALLGVLSNFPRAQRWRSLSADISMRAGAGATSSSFGAGGR